MSALGQRRAWAIESRSKTRGEAWKFQEVFGNYRKALDKVEDWRHMNPGLEFQVSKYIPESR